MDGQLVGVSFQVSEAGPTAWTLRTYIAHYRYGGITEANHTCKHPRPLKIGDRVVVQRIAEPSKDVIVLGPCGCKYLLYALRTTKGTTRDRAPRSFQQVYRNTDSS